MEFLTAEEYWLARWIFERALAAIYLVAFVVARNQFDALLADDGLTPVREVLEKTDFKSQPSIFHWHYSDRFYRACAWTGIVLSGAAVVGLPASGPIWLHVTWWLIVWFLYLSIVNTGGRFYGFGWESMMLEAGFFAAFLGPDHVMPSIVPLIILRWLLFRVEFGAGLIKLRHDSCWRDLTCLYYHHETQPLPNPLSWHFHHLPKPVHRLSVLFSHVVQLGIPVLLFLPQPFAATAGGLIILHQCVLIASGNYSWLNWLTLLLALAALPDTVLAGVVPVDAPDQAPLPFRYELLLVLLAVVTVLLSVKPTLNLFSSSQRMNYSYNPIHLLNTYGAFGSVTRTRYELVVEGIGGEEDAEWREYEFKAKPGNPARRPPQVAPYHYRIDWMMWFLPIRAVVGPQGVHVPAYEQWFLRLLQKLLQGDATVLKLLSRNPFTHKPPRRIRVRFFRYEFTSAAERSKSGDWWKRSPVGDYLPPVTLEDL